MPHFVLSHTQTGPIIDLVLTASIPRLAALQAAGTPAPQPIPVKALVDTGASHTSIDPSIIVPLGLVATGVASVITPTTGNNPCSVLCYDVGIHVPFPEGTFWSQGLWVVSAMELLHQGFAVLLGRDILAHGMLVYDGKHNTFTLSF